jgi:DNA repair protein RadA/Sms
MLVHVSKLRKMYICQTCGGTQSRWMGKCPECGAWDSLVEHQVDRAATADPHRGAAEGGEAMPVPEPVRLCEVEDLTVQRLSSGLVELDRVLGGRSDRSGGIGFVPGSAIMLGGDPGIGKSTLMLQVAGRLAAAGETILYVSSEESAQQLQLRARRLGVGDHERLYVLADTNLARIAEQIRRLAPRLVVIDSVQMIYKADLEASPGSVSQLRRCATELVYLAKSLNVAVVLVGHVTKDGALAGPKLMEHIVDVVLSFEGDRYYAHRIVRGIKNRFGATLEIGLFEMTECGLVESPHAIGAAVESWDERRSGAVVSPVMMGSRCVLVELQALTATGFPGAVKRKASGIDSNRLAMLIAVLEQHGGLRLSDRDVFASSIGGLKVAEPAADLPIAIAIAGAHLDRALTPYAAMVGEVGLGGEVRTVSQLDQRVREAVRLGARHVIAPAGVEVEAPDVTVHPVRHIGQAIELLS